MVNNMIDVNFWKNKKVLITGHTGFKGSWLTMWLHYLGAEVKGYALLPPTTPNLYDEAKINDLVESDIGDIRDIHKLKESITKFNPEIIIHMAAQPLVRYSYENPVETYETNVLGSVNLLEVAKNLQSLRVLINVTTDKCYENKEWEWGYRENEAMGGYDPYSSSKGCAELVTAAYRQSFYEKNNKALSTARAGNVIGGGDWAKDRLIPDILKSFQKKEKVLIRNPIATRPWQHVLEPLSGYLILAQKMFEEPKEYSSAWNFGPKDDGVSSVKYIVEELSKQWSDDASWGVDETSQFHEANLLKLDISKANNILNWSPKWSLELTIEKIIQWHKAWLNNENTYDNCLNQIKEYMEKD